MCSLGPVPRAVAATNRPKLFVVLEESESPSQGERLAITGRGFAPGQDVMLRSRELETLQTPVRVDEKGQFATTLPFPESLPFGTFTLEALSASVKLTASEFNKPFSVKDLNKRDRAIDKRQQRR